MACDTDLRRLRFHGKLYTGQTMKAYCKTTKHEVFLPSKKSEPNVYIEVCNSGVYESIVFIIDSNHFREELWLHIDRDEFSSFADELRTLLNDSE